MLTASLASLGEILWLDSEVISVVNKDLTLKAKAKDLISRTSLKTAFDRGVFECWI